MFTKIKVLSADQLQQKSAANLAALKAIITTAPVANGPVFVIGSWQSGDFCHIYAAAVRHYSLSPQIPFSILVLQAAGFGDAALLKDTEFAVASVANVWNSDFTLLHTDAMSKDRAVDLLGKLLDGDRTKHEPPPENTRSPFQATFWAAAAVKAMSNGQPLTEVLAALARQENSEYYRAYAAACQSFMQEYVAKFGISLGREKFVCLWARTSGAPTPNRPLGGANPQYDSSETSNHELCEAIYNAGLGLKAIFTVGGGFAARTKGLPYVFDLGEFWRRIPGVQGRFQENGFFDFMTAFYDVDVVHVGMKSGGMDTLGLWGQKVVFIDGVRAPDITKGRVNAWATKHIQPVEIGEMPTPLGKAIEADREAAAVEQRRGFGTSFGKATEVERLQAVAANKTDGFERADLDKIVTAVRAMLTQSLVV